VLAAWMPRFKTLPKHNRAAITILLGVLAAAAYYLHTHGTLEHRVMPWLGHVIGTESIFPNSGEMLGSRPITLNLFSRAVLSLVVIAAASICVVDTWPFAAESFSRNRRKEATALLVPFTISYIALLVPRAFYSFLYDRYLLGIMPGALAVLLLLYEHRFHRVLPAWTFAILGIFSAYTVAATHDWFALNRARVQAVDRVHKAGVPLTQIQGGFDFDGWTQIEHAGSISSEHIKMPRHTLPDKLEPECRLNFSPYTPAVTPEYFVVFHPMPCLANSQFAPVGYHSWLPPTRRSIYVQHHP